MIKDQYEQNLKHLAWTFKIFILQAKDYANKYGSEENKSLTDLIYMWAHPKGISNLIRYVTMEYQAEDIYPKDLDISKFITLTKPQVPLYSQEKMQNLPIVIKCPPSSKLSKKIKKSVEKNEYSESQIQDEGEGEQSQLKKIQSHFQPSQCSQSEDNKKYKRGPYKNYTTQEKIQAVEMYRQQKLTITEISKKLGIPCKNIKRWATEGVSRKIGGGRKRTNPLLQEQVYSWVISEYALGESISIDLIQKYALSQSADPYFKASRGWATKFIQRYKLREYYKFI